MKKKLLFSFIVTLLCTTLVNAQTKFGDNKSVIQSGSLVEMETTNKGLLLPRLTSAQMNSIPVTFTSKGMTVYNTDSACICQYNGIAWRSLCTMGTYTEPWYDKLTKTGAALNTQDIYQSGRVHIGTDYSDLLEAYKMRVAIKGKPDNSNSLLVYDTLTANPTAPQTSMQVNYLALNTNDAPASHGGGASISAMANVIQTISPFRSTIPMHVQSNVGLDINGTYASEYFTLKNAAYLNAFTSPYAGGIDNNITTALGTSITGNFATLTNSAVINGSAMKQSVGLFNRVNYDNNATVSESAIALDNNIAINSGTAVSGSEGVMGIRNNLTNADASATAVWGIKNTLYNNAAATIPGATYGMRTDLTHSSTTNGGGVYGHYNRLVYDGTGTQTGFLQPAIIGETTDVTISAGTGDAGGSRTLITVSGGTRDEILANDNKAFYTGTANINKVAGLQSRANYNSDGELNPASNTVRYFGGLYGINTTTDLTGAGTISRGANIMGIRNFVISSRSAALAETMYGIRTEVFVNGNATHNMGVGNSTRVGRFQGSANSFDTAYAHTASGVATKLAAGYVIGDFNGNIGGSAISTDLNTGIAYGFAVTTNALYKGAGDFKTFAFYAQDGNDKNAFIGNTGIGTENPQRKLHIVPAAGAATSLRIEVVQPYADNAAALSAGLVAGDVYRTGDILKIVH